MTRFGYVMVTYFATMGVAIAAFIPTPLRLVWNASASVPIGLYDLERPSDLAVGDLVAVMPDKLHFPVRTRQPARTRRRD